MGAVGFIRGCWDHWSKPWVPSGSCGVTGFTVVRQGGRRVHPASLDSLGCAMEAVEFIRCRWVLWGAHWGPSGSSGVAGITGVRPGSSCSSGVAGFTPWGSSGSSGTSEMTGVCRGSRRVHPGSLGPLRCTRGS